MEENRVRKPGKITEKTWLIDRMRKK